MTPDDRIVETIRLYRDALRQSRELYVDSGKLIRGSYGWLTGQDNADASVIASQMDDLHRGFVMKTFADAVADTDQRTPVQRQLGRVLLEHIWGTPVLGDQLQEATDWAIETARGFSWEELIRPFAEIPAIRDRMGEVETLAVRMSNLIAHRAGDNVGLQAMQQDFDRLREQAPEHLASETDTASAREALHWLREEAKRLKQRPAEQSQDAEPTERSSRSQSQPSTQYERSRSATKSNEPEASQSADTRTPEERLKEARKKLDQLIGLEAVKDQIETLTNFLKMETQRREAGLPTTQPSLHMAFVGNPGTGKTTVARIIAEIYGALGVLEKGHLVETDRSGLVAEYAGQTGPKTNVKIDEALDGVLFIDEAYTLIDTSGQDQYGREAVQTLLKRMEDQRDRLVVILAGYPVEMHQMIRSNPGLSSRVGTTLHFDDYPPEALCRIFELIAGKAKYSLPTESRRRLLRGFNYLFNRRDRHFGNGRCARNSFERSVRRLANRLATVDEVTSELLTTLQADDIEVAGIEMPHLRSLAQSAGKVRSTCGQCQTTCVLDDAKLGQQVCCEQCNQAYRLDWGEPVMDDE